MPLLSDIQQDILEDKPLAPILLKLRFLASRLGSDVLEDWVRLEIGGYGEETEVPPYRRLPVTYTASFIGPAGSQMNNAPVPSAIISSLASDNWLTISERQSVSAVENIVASVQTSGGSLHVDSSNLILALQGKMYPRMSCVSVTGKISVGSVVALLNSVRSRVLELTIQIEKSAPVASTITSGKSADDSAVDAGSITNITQHVVYGNYTSISNSDHAIVDDSSENKRIEVSGDRLFSEIHQALHDGGIDKDGIAKIMGALAELKSASDKPSRISAYNRVVSVCADHIGILSPFLEPLKNMFL